MIAPQRKLEVLPAGVGYVMVGYRIGAADMDMHGFVFCVSDYLLAMLGQVDEIVARHYPCQLCNLLGYGPEQLRRDLPSVLPVQ